MLMGILDHDDGGIDHGADGNRNAAEAHDVGTDPHQPHDDHGNKDADRQHDDGDEGAADMQQENETDEGDDDAFLDEGMLQVVDGPVDQLRAVIDRLDMNALGQALGDIGDLRLHIVDDVEGILAETLQGNAADDFALTIQFGDAAAL